MSGLDLDKLKSQWAQETCKLDDSLTLDIEAVRFALAKKTSKAFRRHSHWLMASLLVGIATFAALMTFIVHHLNDSAYLLLATPLAMFVLAECIVQFLQWHALRTLDLSSPIIKLHEILDRLRDRRLRLTKWVLLSSVLLWWPLILVVVKGFTGIDLLPKFPASFIIINAIIGFSFIPTAYLVARYFSNRFSHSAGFRKFLEEAAGKSWSRAREQLDARQGFEDDVAIQGDAKALQRFEKKNLLSPAANALLRSIKNRVLLSILFYASLMLLIGIFNAIHGGQWQFIVPGILLNLFFVSQMVGGITWRISSQRLDLALPGNALANQLEKLLAMRMVLARISLSLLPIIGLVCLQVMTKVLAGKDLIGTLSGPLLGVIIAMTLAVVVVIHRNAKTSAVAAFANISGFGAFKSSKMLIAEIKQAASE